MVSRRYPPTCCCCGVQRAPSSRRRARKPCTGYPAGTVGNLYGSYADGSARRRPRSCPGGTYFDPVAAANPDNVVGWTASSRGLNPGAPHLIIGCGGYCVLPQNRFAMVPLASMLLGNRRPPPYELPRCGLPESCWALQLWLRVSKGVRSGAELLPLAVGGYLALFFAAAAVIMAAGRTLLGARFGNQPGKRSGHRRRAGACCGRDARLALPGKAAWTSFTLVGVAAAGGHVRPRAVGLVRGRRATGLSSLSLGPRGTHQH